MRYDSHAQIIILPIGAARHQLGWSHCRRTNRYKSRCYRLMVRQACPEFIEWLTMNEDRLTGSF
ncbi:MAG: hypothetical protein HY538_01535 [Deltaproteobacteria bacterium]|nr:hypothetical protein [Deltaproteobacteria bacterium]